MVWGGGAWWLFHQAQPGWGVFILVWGAVLVSASDNLIRPLLIKRGVAMPLTLVILGVFGGFLSFGFLGLFIGPALLAVAFTLLRAWRAVDVHREDGDIAASRGGREYAVAKPGEET
nr:AI-2E family transporter [Pseudoroseomonas coralli]